MEQETVVIEQLDFSAIEAQDKAVIDRQIATAKQYPRNIHRAKDNIIAITTMDEETAKSCGFALPRDGKNITGPSVHLARIVVQQYGNIRVDTRIARTEDKSVVAQATCIDLENNVGIRVEVSRRITNKYGKRFNDDMINMTGQAAISIALRNAVYNVVPKPLIDAGYKAAQQKLVGDISDENKLASKRMTAIEHFQKEYGVDEAALLKALKLNTSAQIKGEELKILFGITQALKDGDSTVDEVFYPEKLAEQSTEAKKDDLKKKNSENGKVQMP